jgi:hypothetical protein
VEVRRLALGKSKNLYLKNKNQSKKGWRSDSRGKTRLKV